MPKQTLFSDPQLLPCANLSWCEGNPMAADFDDVYGSTDDAVAEKTHVFLTTNKLAQRFAEVDKDTHFSLLELGFGGGLNFLLTWQLWQQQRHGQAQSARLVYTSIEAYPMAKADLQRWQQWPQLQQLAKQLQEQYPLPIKGFHQLRFDDVTLNLILAPVEEALPQIEGQVDAIYLDGFNPAHNPAMWQASVMQGLARLSHQQTTIATYSAASAVREPLAAAGFAATTRSGFGKKRHQLGGVYTGTSQVSANSSTKQPHIPAYIPPWQRPTPTLAPGARVAVIGAGISGCSSALALQERGYQVQLIERADAVAQAASGNKQGMLYAKLPDSAIVSGQLHQQGLQHSMCRLRSCLSPEHWQATGLLQLAQDETEHKRMQRLVERQFPPQWLAMLSAEQAAQQAQTTVSAGGLNYAEAGWVSPPAWCQALAEQLHQAPWFNTSLVACQFEQNQWHLCLAGEHAANHVFDAVVLCNASDAKQWLPELDLPLQSIRGQVSYVNGSFAPATVVCGEGYVTPATNGTMAVGASYNLGSEDTQMQQQDHLDNLQRLRQLLPDSKVSSMDICGGRVGFRATTPDYLPLVGQLADAQQMLHTFAHLRKDKNYRFKSDMPWLAGLYVNAGHGSKGLITAPLCAELLAAQIAGEVLPMSSSVAAALAPNRFFLRDMMRRKR
jgi:tRNA 5-methylaminomethyl-2-thiouridine biosynthesis bifunctional protein